MPGPYTAPVDYSVPFDVDAADAVAAGFTTEDDIHQALIYTYNNSPGTAARFGLAFGANANAKNKWIDYFSGVSSDTTPFVGAETLSIISISAAAASSTSGEFEVYKNMTTLIYTMTFSAQVTKLVTGLSISLAVGDTLSVKVNNTATITSPIMTIFVKVDI